MKQNYTKEQETKLAELYGRASTDAQRSEVVETLAKELNKTTQSIVGKLASMKIYQPKQKMDKTGEPITSKAELVKAIRIFTGVREHELTSLEKASKQDLKRLIDVFRDFHNKFELTN